MFKQIGPTEILLILGVVLLLFGGRKLPELARGSGRALRIFKSEVKGLHDDDDDPDGTSRADRAEAKGERPGPEALDAPAAPTSAPAGEPRAAQRDRGPEQG